MKLYVAPDDVRKTPTLAFRVKDFGVTEVCERLLEGSFFVAGGHFYASTLAESIEGSGGFVRVGLAPYNTAEGIEGFVEALERLVSGAWNLR